MYNKHTTDWSIAIFACRESYETLASCVKSVIDAINNRTTTIHILVNGNTRLLQDSKSNISKLCSEQISIRLWWIEHPDKANAWNQFIYSIASPSGVNFFIDSYIKVHKNSLLELENLLKSDNTLLAATGTPCTGSSSENLKREMLSSGGIHGNLYALPKDSIIKLKEVGFALPINLYRTDGVMGAILSFNFHPQTNTWDPKRVAVSKTASWTHTPLRWWKLSDIKTQIKRFIRQSQGDLENAAVKKHYAIEKGNADVLEDSCKELIVNWVNKNSKSAQMLFLKKPLRLYSYIKIKSSKRIPEEKLKAIEHQSYIAAQSTTIDP